MKRTSAIVLLVTSCALMALSVVAMWVQVGVLDVDRYVEAVTPVAEGEAATEAATDLITRRLLERVSLTAIARELADLPEGALPEAALGRAQRLVKETVRSVLSSEQYAAVWVQANRDASRLVRHALVGGVATVEATRADGLVIVDLTPALVMAQGRLVRAGITAFAGRPVAPGSAQLELADLSGLRDVRSAVTTLVTARWALVAGAILLLAVGLAGYDRRLRGAAFWGGGVAVSLGLMLLLLWAARHLLIDGEIDPDLRPVQAAVFDAVTAPLRTALALGIAIGAMVLVAASEVARGPGNTPHT